ncbi:hypothetical protein KKA27_01535 [Patescibacteria group bacterium]|nr:hypothetical protein [Patescibacteria group bacterium]
MKKQIILLVTLIFCFLMFVPAFSFAEIKTIEHKKIVLDGNPVEVGRVCIGGYEYVVATLNGHVAITQSFEIIPATHEPIPKRCK